MNVISLPGHPGAAIAEPQSPPGIDFHCNFNALVELKKVSELTGNFIELIFKSSLVL